MRVVLGDANGFHAIRYDLFQGSEVSLEWDFDASRFGPSLLILRTEEAYNLFRQGDLQDVPLSDKLHEIYHSTKGEFVLKTHSRSEYYFIFYMAEQGSASGSATFRVSQNTINLTNPPPITSSLIACPDSPTRCYLPFSSNGGHAHLDTDYYLVLVPPASSEYGDLFSIRVAKMARPMKYVGAIVRTALFVVVVGGFVTSVLEWMRSMIGSLVSLLFCCACIKDPRERLAGYRSLRHDDDVESGDLESGRLSNGGNQEVDPLVPRPPVRMPSDAPPAYSVVNDEEDLGEDSSESVAKVPSKASSDKKQHDTSTSTRVIPLNESGAPALGASSSSSTGAN
ncbi:hypothetical protein HDU98_010276 [Podochytrium sp. JEL0797]|nr:hypothetical protein HDU98_010276 [Podochytrium sp. JEL0797]